MINILIAEDDMVIRKVIQKNTASPDYNVFTASDGDEASRILREQVVHIAILDWMLPGTEGIELCRKIRTEKNIHYSYIILLTSKADPDDLIEGFRAGADDYIKKPFNSLELQARIKTGKRIIELQTELLATQEKLRIQATHDGLTKMLNRNSIFEILESEFERSGRGKSSLGMIMADIDHFKKINDTYGHQAGDMVLKKVAHILKKSIRRYDRVGRYGGEEFLILLPDCDANTIEKIAERLREKISQEDYLFNDQVINVTISMGLSVSKGGAFSSPEAMITVTDTALYEAKRNGRNRWIMADTDAQPPDDGPIGDGPGFIPARIH
jgi:two-component system cell cycle response regulator